MDVATSSPADTTALVAPAVHAPPAHGSRPLHGEPAGSDGGGGAHPQSMQSCPYGHRLNSEPGPPSSQSPSLVCTQSLMHKLG
eukprot:305414-Prymnesium_polylepis.1